MKSTKKDYLNFRPTLHATDDKVFLSCKVVKFNKAGFRSDINFVLTKNFICTFKEVFHQTKVAYNDLEMISVSKKSSEFVLHFYQRKDCRYLSYELRHEIIHMILYVVCEVHKLSAGIKICAYSKINLDNVWSPKLNNDLQASLKWNKVESEVHSYESYTKKIDADHIAAGAQRRNTRLLFSAEAGTSSSNICANDFELLARLGYEHFGRCYLVHRKSTKVFYVMKIFWKQKMLYLNKITQGQYQQEVEVLQRHNNAPLIIRLEFAFDTPENVYYVHEYAKGKDLLTYLLFNRRFEESQAKFYAACLVLAIGFLHNKQTYCNQLRLKNIYVSDNGYIKLYDFRLCKFRYQNLTPIDTLFWTTDQDPPEAKSVIEESRMGDWWLLGVLIYKMLFGKPPFLPAKHSGLENSGMGDQLLFFNEDVPISKNAQNLLRALLRTEPSERLGFNSDSLEVMSHPWFESIDIFEILEERLPAPFIPELASLEHINFKFF